MQVLINRPPSSLFIRLASPTLLPSAHTRTVAKLLAFQLPWHGAIRLLVIFTFTCHRVELIFSPRCGTRAGNYRRGCDLVGSEVMHVRLVMMCLSTAIDKKSWKSMMNRFLVLLFLTFLGGVLVFIFSCNGYLFYFRRKNGKGSVSLLK